MLKVMIVDDEVLARVGIKSLIPWQENNFELIGECDNGESGFKMACEKKPDIIISDIKMPLMNGIELLKAVKDEGLPTKFIMLSSYDDFDLVREAMKLGADDYLLKLQLEPEELIKVLKEIRIKIELEQDKTSDSGSANAKIQMEIDLLKERFLKELIYGNHYTEEEIVNYLNLYKLELKPQKLLCMVIHLDESDSKILIEDTMFISSMANIIAEGIRNYGTGQVICCSTDIYALVCSLSAYSSEELIKEAILRMSTGIQEYIRNSLNVSTSIGISTCDDGYKSIRRLYLEAMEVIRSNKGLLKGTVSRFDNIGHSGNLFKGSHLDEEVNELATSLRTNNAEAIEIAFSSLLQGIDKMKHLSDKHIIGNSHLFVYVVNDFITNNRLNSEDIWGDEENQYLRMSKIKNITDYRQWVYKIRENILCILKNGHESNTVILRAKQFVNSNIDKNITLAQIADYLGLSSSYFSRLFSKETGQGFIDFMTGEKVKLSKKLLRTTNMKVYEIAEAVGYENVYYFSRVFKKNTGVSPMEFKAGHKGESGSKDIQEMK